MISGIGCDIVEHSKTIKLGWLEDKSILKGLFSQKEIAFAPKKELEKYYSGKFAAKEVVLKCLGIGMVDGIALKNIEILPDQDGKMIIKLSGEIEKIATSKDISNIHISISHSEDYSIAFGVAELQSVVP